MKKKHKKSLARIIVTAVIFVALIALDKLGVTSGLPEAVRFALYFIPYMIIGYDVIFAAFRNVIRGNFFEENFLMTVATFAAFALGFFGDGEYPEALAVMLFYQVGELVQDLAVERSRRSITEMMELAPEVAEVERDGRIEQTDPEEVSVGEIIVVRPGEKIPLDGVVVEGSSFIDTSSLTGESVPRGCRPGDEVISGCVNGEGLIKIRTTKEYEDSTVAKILDLVENASLNKAKLENFITRFARVYTPAVTLCAVALALILPLVFKEPWSEGIRRACSFLIVSCPCALVISVPVGFFGGIAAASKIGVLVKGSNYLEAAASLDTVVFDKTGTLTKGEFTLSSAHPANGFDEARLIELAAYAEAMSAHPIARSIAEAYKGEIDRSRLSRTAQTPGKGVSALLDGVPLLAGNAAMMEENGVSFDPCPAAGTVVYVAYGGIFAGSLVISDSIKPEAAEALSGLRSSGVKKTVMLTGDRHSAAKAAADELGIDVVRSELLPGDKMAEIEALSDALPKGGRLAFVGDGVNDAPALMRADVGFAMGSLGSDAAIEAADVVIMDDDLTKPAKVIAIARKTLGIVKSNVIFAIAVKLIILVLGALGVASMWAAVFGDVGVTILCVLNSLRALRHGR